MGENVLQAVDAWRQEGLALADRIEAERDTVRHRIDQDHAYMVTLNERLREVRATLGLDATDARPARGRIVAMSRDEQKSVPVEHVSPSASAAAGTRLETAVAFLRSGKRTAAELAAHMGVTPAVAAAYFSTLRAKGLAVSEPIDGTRALLWSLAPTALHQ
jgi:hypothetical protein